MIYPFYLNYHKDTKWLHLFKEKYLLCIIRIYCLVVWASQVSLVVKNPLVNAGDICKRYGFDPWVGNMPWRRAGETPPVFLPGESHAQRNIGVTWGHNESETTEAT